MPSYNHKLLMYNNDVYDINTVVDTISLVCNMHSMAAEQCATITNNTGKSVIKEGGKKLLLRLKKDLFDILPHLDTEIIKED